MHYEIHLYRVEAVGGASRRASSTGMELEAALDTPTRVLTFDTLAAMAIAKLDDHGDLLGLTYAVDDDGTVRPISATELAQALEANT
jgi:hypothetical protein